MFGKQLTDRQLRFIKAKYGNGKGGFQITNLRKGTVDTVTDAQIFELKNKKIAIIGKGSDGLGISKIVSDKDC